MVETVELAVGRYLESVSRFAEVAPLLAATEADAERISGLAGRFHDEVSVYLRTALRVGEKEAKPSEAVVGALDRMDALIEHMESSVVLYGKDALPFDEVIYSSTFRDFDGPQLDALLANLPGLKASPGGFSGSKRKEFVDEILKQSAGETGEEANNHERKAGRLARVIHGLMRFPGIDAAKRWKALALPALLALLRALGVPIPPELAGVPGDVKLQWVDMILEGLNIFSSGEPGGNCEITVVAKSVVLSASPDIEDWGEIVIQFEVDGTSKRWPETGVFEPGGSNFSLGDTEIGKFTRPGCGAHTFSVKATFIDRDSSLIPFDDDDTGANQMNVSITCEADPSTHELKVDVREGGDASDDSPIKANIKFEVSSECDAADSSRSAVAR